MLAFFSTFWNPCSKCILMCFKEDRGRFQVSKCPKVLELGQRSTKCKFLYKRQILAFLSISHPKIMIQSNAKSLLDNAAMLYKQTASSRHDMCLDQRSLKSKSVKIVAIFYLYRGKILILSSLLFLWKSFFYCCPAR